MKDMHALCDFYIQKNKIMKERSGDDESQIEETKDQSRVASQDEFDLVDELNWNASNAMSVAAHNNLEENLSLIEKTALRVKPILEEVM